MAGRVALARRRVNLIRVRQDLNRHVSVINASGH